MKRTLLFTAIILMPEYIFGQVSGNLPGDTSWGPGIVIVTGTVNANGHTLTILPGTTVKLNDNAGISVQGASSRIIADGEENNPIIFEASSNSWNHIDIWNSTGNVFDYCTFKDGSALDGNNRGGALLINSAGVTVTNCTFFNNKANDGGAISVVQSEPLIENCIFYNNAAVRRGGAIHIREDELSTTPPVTPFINRCKIYSNNAAETGGIHIANNTNALIQNSLIYSNTSTIDGGITTNTFDNISLGYVNIVNCVIANNTPHDVFFRGPVRSKAVNCIIWGSNQSVGYRAEDTALSDNLEYCAVQGVYHYMNGDIPITFFTQSFKLNSSNSAADGPNFINPLTDYSILSVSPCKDNGTSTNAPATDILGYSRTPPYDIGAYEVQRKFITWTGSERSDCMNTNNWSPQSLPGVSDDVRISNIGNAPVISAGTGHSYNLILEPSARLSVNEGASLTIAGSLILNSSAANNSGSFLNVGTVTGNVVYNRTIPDDGSTQLWHYISSPVNTTGIVSEKVFYPWNEVIGDWGDSTSSISPGIGYTVIGGGSISFIGSVQSSDFSVDATSPYNDVLTGNDYSSRSYVQGDGNSHITRSYSNYGGGGFNLLGNPFTSSLRISDTDGISNNDFLSANLDQFDPNYVAVYIYNGNSYGYIGSSTGWSTNDPAQITGTSDVQVGQAFFILAMNDYAEFIFNREMQVHNTTVELLKSSGSDTRWPGIRLKVRKGETEPSTLIVYDPGMTVDLDPGYDVGFISGGADIEIYSHLPTTGNLNYTRQALPLSGADSVIVPIGIDSRTGGDITFSADAITFKSYRYLLEDRQAGMFIDISNREYKTTLSPETYGTGRFYLHTAYAGRRNTRSSGSPVNESTEVRIWTYGHDVIIKGPVNPGSLCEIFNLQGQIVLSVNLVGEEINTIPTNSNIRGTYIVRVSDGAEVHSTKIIIR